MVLFVRTVETRGIASPPPDGSVYQQQISCRELRRDPSRLYEKFSQNMLTRLLISLCLLVSARQITVKPITIYLIGDSTLSVKAVADYPETGWGMPFAHFFDETVRVDDRAMNGCSTGSFLTENRWQPVVDSLQPGDYVLIQFGHNDEVKTKKTYTTESEFRTNLLRYVNETRARKAHPVLITPVARRKFNAAGELEDTHAIYAELVRTVASEQAIPLIDLDRQSQALLRQLGPNASKLLFNHLAPGEHPNYPSGRTDDTHFNELGARRMAELVLASLRSLAPDLTAQLRQPVSGR